jgi:prepilin-type N-terminal cleavage/methylation domain-containing protein
MIKLARRRRRAASRGFTLMELMVVVVLVAILAVLASPALSEARNDRIAFDYARQFQQILVQGRARAAGTGSSHLAVLGGAPAGNRGYVYLYQALDGQPAAAPGPNPVSSCKADPNQWTQAAVDPPVLNDSKALFIDKATLNRNGVNDDMNVFAELKFGAADTNPTAAVNYLAICITPSGVTYVGSGTSASAAVAAMRSASPFNGLAEVYIQRHLAGGTSATAVGIRRRVVITGGAAPRVRSE